MCSRFCVFVPKTANFWRIRRRLVAPRAPWYYWHTGGWPATPATAPQIRPSKAKPPEAARDQWLPALSRRDTRAREPPETRSVRREWVTTSGLRWVRGDDGVTATPRGTSSVFKSSLGHLPTDLNCGLKVSSSCALLGNIATNQRNVPFLIISNILVVNPII